jgi:hypothetical protein
MWFTEFGGNKIGRITTGGVISEFPVPTQNSGPIDIAAGSDGAMWFAERGGNKIGRITVPTEEPAPSPPSQAPPDTTRPAIAAGLVSSRVRNGRIRVQVFCAGETRCSGTIRGRARGRTIASGSYSATGQSKTVSLKVTKRGRALLRRLGRVRVRFTVTARDAAGNRSTLARNFTVRR